MGYSRVSCRGDQRPGGEKIRQVESAAVSGQPRAQARKTNEKLERKKGNDELNFVDQVKKAVRGALAFVVRMLK